MLVQHASYRLDADVVVIGYGAAGATAAITAHDAGAQVLILEKQEIETPLTNSFMSGGGFICPNHAKAASQYMKALYRVNRGIYWTKPSMIDAWVKYTMQNKEWVEGLGVMPKLFRRGGQHKLPGVESIDVYRIPGMGPGMMRLLYEQVNRRKVPIIRGIHARNLLMNARNEIIGVRALRLPDHKRVDVKARRGVVLATGGFEFDEQMKLHHLKVYPFYFDASPSLTGDGVKMGLEVGAQLWHMNCCAGSCSMKFPEVLAGIRPNFGGSHWMSPASAALQQRAEGWEGRHAAQTAATAGYILTDRYGKRYTNENIKLHTFSYELTLFDSRRLIYPRVPSYWIFDQQRMKDGPLPRTNSGTTGPARIYRWSADNSVELERGWIKSGNSMKELALKLGIDAQALTETVNNYNLYCDSRVDVEFDREPNTLIPLAPPYYAVEVWPGGLNTQGGPLRNTRAQVLRGVGSPISRLYSAGELGSMYGMLYPGGGANLAECFAFGRIAGENAAECHPL